MSVVMVGMRRRAGLCGLLVLPLLAGCAGFFPKTTSSTGTATGSGGGTTSNTGDYAYVASAFVSGSTAIYTLTGFSVGSGALAKLSGFPLTLPFAATTTAITPANTYLYVGGQGFIYGYSISSTGALTQLGSNGSVNLAVANVVAMDISPDGQWLFALDSDGSMIDEYQIQSTGLLAPTTGTAYAVNSGRPVVPSGIRVSKNTSNAYLAVALGTGGDLLYTLNTSTGGLTYVNQLPTPTTSSADQAVTFDAAGATLYVARSGTDGGLVPYAIAQGGALTPVSATPYAAGQGPSAIVIDSTGKYVYVGNKVSGTISGFSIGTGGVLTALSGSPYTSGSGVASLGRDNSGKYLLAAAVNGNPDVQMYSFDGTTPGKLDASGTASTGDPDEPAGAISVALTH